MPLPEGLSREGLTAIALLFAALAMWLCETMNLAAVTIVIVALLPFLKVLDVTTTFSQFAGKVFFFVLATFALTAALATSTIPTRIAGFALKLSGENPFKLIFFFMLGSAILSNILSNVSSCALFAALALAVIKSNGDPTPGSSQLAKALMIGVAIGAMIGGFMSPPGTATNIMIMNILEEAGHPLPFAMWMIIGIPVGLMGCLVAAIWLYISFKPEKVSKSALETAQRQIKEAGPLSTREKKILIIIALLFVFWISSTWLPVLDTTLVALLGMCAFFLPGIEALTWKQFSDNAAWDVLFLIGGVGAMAFAIRDTGAATWFVNVVMAGAPGWSPLIICLMVSAIVCLLHVVNPSGPAVAGIAAAPMIALALIPGVEGRVSPITLAMITAFWSSTAFIFPTDAVTALTYGHGYYKIKDLVKFGIVPTVVLIVLIALAVPLMTGLIGY
jgi:sodium-dependent dicarboxylate transporter 2/3/5